MTEVGLPNLPPPRHSQRFKSYSQLYDWISCVVPDRLYFGPIPNEFMVEKLLYSKFTFIVNVTELPQTIPGIRTFHFPIVDNSVPENVPEYCAFILSIKEAFEQGEKIYLHCLAGHSRSSMVIVSLLCSIFHMELKDIIKKVTDYHRNRVMLREVWKFRSPFNYRQFTFLCMIHKNIYINIDSDSKVYNWLSPKNIWIDQQHTLYDVVNNLADKKVNETDDVCVETLLQSHLYLLSKLKQTHLKKLIFISPNPVLNIFYERLFTSLREGQGLPRPYGG